MTGGAIDVDLAEVDMEMQFQALSLHQDVYAQIKKNLQAVDTCFIQRFFVWHARHWVCFLSSLRGIKHF